jgi:hypothetical protein
MKYRSQVRFNNTSLKGLYIYLSQVSNVNTYCIPEQGKIREISQYVAPRFSKCSTILDTSCRGKPDEPKLCRFWLTVRVVTLAHFLYEIIGFKI